MVCLHVASSIRMSKPEEQRENYIFLWPVPSVDLKPADKVRCLEL